MFHFKLEKFEGPLDLLLNLIQEEKFDISELSLANVTDDYLRYIEANPEISPDELADFLVVATKLLLIKSRLLLPELPAEDEDSSGLAKQLRIYQEYLQAMNGIEAMIAKRQFWFAREKPPSTINPAFAPGQELNRDKLHKTFTDIIKSLEKLVILPQSVMDKTVSLQEKISQIKEFIKKASRLSFHDLMQSARSKTEVIVSFLALLELIKQQEIHVRQDNNFDDIVIKRAAPQSADQS